MIFKYIRHRSKRVLGIVQEPLEKEGSQKKINSDLNSWQTRKVQSFVVFEKGKKERNKKSVKMKKLLLATFTILVASTSIFKCEAKGSWHID